MTKIRTLYGAPHLLSRDRVDQVQVLFRQSFPTLAHYADEIPSLLRDPMRHGFRSALLLVEGAMERVDAFALVLHFPDVDAMFLDFIATRPEARSRGLGGALYEAVREFAQLHGARGLYMEVEPDDPGLTPDPEELAEAKARIGFYERYGVRVVENQPYTEPAGDPPATAVLLFDGLGRTNPLGKDEVRAAMTQILNHRFGRYVHPEYTRGVIEAFRDDPVQLRPFRYQLGELAVAAPLMHRLAPAFSLVASPRHEMHHVKERGYFERPVRVRAIREALEPTGWFAEIACREFGEGPILEVHEKLFIRYLRTVCSRFKATRPVYPDTFPLRQSARRPRGLPVQAGYYCIDCGTPLYPNAYVAARSSVNTALTASRELLSGKRLSYAICRPPGHHAGPAYYGGFCYFNNAGIAAHQLSREGKVAILDIDFHHGNGTQDLFYDRDDILTVSIHGHPDHTYPYFSGYADETGEGPGLGCNLNLPLPAGTDEKRYLGAFRRALARIGKFAPDVVVVSLGFDTMKGDPTGTFTLGARSLRILGGELMQLGKPLLVVQEGGYNVRNIRSGVRQFFSGCADAIR